jgi:antitoxin (DNA-binding transcriptional repressor) of toxin-antitoxin stability system
VERGEEVVITRHGRAVARLVPNTPQVDQAQAQSAFERIRGRAQLLHKTKAKRTAFGWPALKKLRDQGRS